MQILVGKLAHTFQQPSLSCLDCFFFCLFPHFFISSSNLLLFSYLLIFHCLYLEESLTSCPTICFRQHSDCILMNFVSQSLKFLQLVPGNLFLPKYYKFSNILTFSLFAFQWSMTRVGSFCLQSLSILFCVLWVTESSIYFQYQTSDSLTVSCCSQAYYFLFLICFIDKF